MLAVKDIGRSIKEQAGEVEDDEDGEEEDESLDQKLENKYLDPTAMTGLIKPKKVTDANRMY